MQNNPYVGPRPYERADQGKFYGRNREARDLLDMLVAERVVLFYAQSGAGKSSLLNAKVIPDLEARGFRVLPPLRVGSDVPPRIDAAAIPNIFVFSTLLSLAASDTSPEALTSHTLLSFLQTLDLITSRHSERSEESASPILPILIWDQFEELFTTHRDRWEETPDFFVQVAAAMEGIPELGVVFVMREDHIAAIEPYTPLIPRRLRARFRMERLDYAGALEAIRKPALHAGCPFAEGAAEQLVDNLRRIKTQGGGGKTQEVGLGPYVEPVQLQVVCSRLWERLPDQPDNAIQWDEVEQYGNVDRALEDFYETALVEARRPAASVSPVSERQLRRWFSEQLITPMETRGLVMRGPDDTAGLPNAAVDALEAQHLIRADVRAGARWYELSHDRMVEPILKSNRAWEAKQDQMHPWRPVARQWETTQSETWLYRGKELEKAQSWLETVNSDEVEEYEHAFIQASLKTEQARIKKHQRDTILAIGGGLLLVIMVILTLWAVTSRQEVVRQKATAEAASTLAKEQQIKAETAEADALRQANLAIARELSAEAITNLTIDPERSILLALYALDISGTEEKKAENALRQALIASRIERRFLDENNHFWGLDFSPDGKHAAVAGSDSTIKIWNVTDNTSDEPELTLTGHTKEVVAVAFSADGRQLASASLDLTVVVWDVASRKPQLILSSFQQEVWAVAFSPDGSRLATASQDGMVRIWDIVSGKEIFSPLIGHNGGGVSGVAFSPDGKHLATAGQDKMVVVWDISSESPRAQYALAGHSDTVYDVIFSPDGNYLATASQDKTVILWDISGGVVSSEPKLTLFGHTDSIADVRFSPNGLCMATASSDRTAKVWDAKTGQVLLTLYGHNDQVRGVSFNPSLNVSGAIPTERCGTQLVTTSFDGTLRIWNIGANGEWRTFTGHTDAVESVVFSPDGARFATASSDGTAKIWDSATGQVLHNLATHKDRVNRVVFSPDGTRLATASYDGTAKLWDVNSGKELHSFVGHTGKVYGLDISPDARVLTTASADGSIIFWDVTFGKPLQVLPIYGNGAVYDVAFSRDGVYLVIVGEGYEAFVWSLDPITHLAILDPTALLTVLEHDNSVCDVAFSPSGAYLATASWDTSARLWSATSTWDEQLRLTGHADRVFGLDFSADSKLLATASADKTVIVWDVSSRDALMTLPGAGKELNSVAFNPDGTQLAVAGDDGTVRLYLLDLESLLEVAKARLTRSWSNEECKQYLHQVKCPFLP